MEMEKIKLFKDLFKGRDDVYPRMFTNRAGKTGYSPVCKKRFKDGCDNRCYKCTNSDYKPLDDSVIKQHLEGKEVVGIYPLLFDESSCFIAGDFDNHAGDHDPLKDAKEFYEVCQVNEIPCYIERSRSGKGYHAWIFFDSKVSAWKSRLVMFALLREAQAVDEDTSLKSFDRLFPNQDKLSGKGLGNLIALPLQGKALQQGNTTFLDMNNGCTPYPNQWNFLSTVQRVSEDKLDQLIKKWNLKRDVHKPVSTEVSKEIEQPGIEKVLECDFIKWCGDNPQDVREPLWYGMVSNLARFKGGIEQIHEFSRGHPTYSPEETDRKINHSLRSANPHTCEYIKKNGFNCSKSCEVRSPAGLAYKSDNKKVTIDGIIYTETDQGYKRIEPHTKKTLSSFTIKPTLRIRLPEGETIKADVAVSDKIYKGIHFARDSWNSNQKFKRALPYCDMQWYGSDYDIQKVLALITKYEIQSKQGTTLLGYNNGLWIIKDLVLSKDGRVEDSETIYVPSGNSLEDIINYSPTEDYQILVEDIYNNILEINQPSTILPINRLVFCHPFYTLC